MATEQRERGSGEWRTGQGRVPAKANEYIPPGMRSARRRRSDMWPLIWMSFGAILLLLAALVILAYRSGARGSP
jgi:hypothetical protein